MSDSDVRDFFIRHKVGGVVPVRVTHRIKGGLQGDVEGVNVFLPTSQVDFRRVSDVAAYINMTIECTILKMDEATCNIVVSRRKLLLDQRTEMKEKLLKEIKVGQVREGVVKSIVEFGAFVDLGGIDGLLHATEMTWGRIKDPHEMVRIDQQIEVYILNVEKDKESIALSLRHLTPNPWANVAEKYPVGSRHQGQVANMMSYGAFVKLEPDIEGLVHVSAMSWTRCINHPSELLQIGDQVEVQVLNFNKEKQEISLGMKQLVPKPWDRVVERYPRNTVVTGVVRNLTNYGAFVEIEEGIDGLLHVSDLSWVRKGAHPSQVVQIGDKVTCVVLNVDPERERIALGLRQMNNDPWKNDIPARYRRGDIKKGKVAKVVHFGVFVELEPGLEGLLHISELADKKVDSSQDVVNVGDEIEVEILHVNTEERKIRLSRKRIGRSHGQEDAAQAASASRHESWSSNPSPDEVDAAVVKLEHVECEVESPREHRPGDVVRGTIRTVNSSGEWANVEMEGGVPSLADLRATFLPAFVMLDLGELVEVQVVRMDRRRKRLAVRLLRFVPESSIPPHLALAEVARPSAPRPPGNWDEITRKYQLGGLVKGVVRNITTFRDWAEMELQDGEPAMLDLRNVDRRLLASALRFNGRTVEVEITDTRIGNRPILSRVSSFVPAPTRG